ncbi:MAG: DUF4956 domain-containing protein [Erysipelotrichaceae bacterium]|nr:DUF4956 domain-containing protein [Erysipelotrichaceae bacterium]
MFTSVLNSATNSLSIAAVLLCLAASVVCGLIIALAYRASEHPSKGFLLTLAVLPAVVQMIILMVNGNLGVGVAVAGSFSLVRFRSLPGKASDILIIFLAMGIGLCTGMGYIWFALAAAVIISGLYLLYGFSGILEENKEYRNIRITMPEDLDYTGVFEEVFQKYTKSCTVESVRTINLGTMFQVEYSVVLKDAAKEKEMLDQIRVRNGNLPLICGRTPTIAGEL